MFAADTRQFHDLALEVGAGADLAVGPHHQMGAERSGAVDRDDQRLERGIVLMDPGELDAVEDAELNFVVLELAGEVVGVA